ncbi:hypothetical protein [Nitrosomonas communis]|uniref:hypothetical protein n=1 Tax=Nitrosomonas communis TaxID=44574 RepID=UPI003D26FECD
MMFKDGKSFALNACAFIIFGACAAFGFGSMQLLLPAKGLWVIVCYADEIDTVEMCRPLEELKQPENAGNTSGIKRML